MEVNPTTSWASSGLIGSLIAAGFDLPPKGARELSIRRRSGQPRSAVWPSL